MCFGLYIYSCFLSLYCFFFQAEDGIRDLVRSRGLGDVYKRQFNSLAITFDRCFFNSFFYARTLAHTSGINNHDFLSVVFQMRVLRFTRCVGDRGYDGALLANDGVYERGLSDVRAADKRDAERELAALNK